MSTQADRPRRRLLVAATVLVACAAAQPALLAQSPAESAFVPVTDAMLQAPAPGDWPMWRRTLDGWGYSPLDQIDRGQRGRPASGLVPRPARRGAAAGHSAGLRRRAVHAESERRHPGHRRGDRGPAVGVPAVAARRRVRAHHARGLHHEPQPRHLRRADHRHQRRRVRVRPRREDRRAGLGDAGARLPDPSGEPEHGADHRQRQGHLGTKLHARGGTRRLRHHRARPAHRRGALAAAHHSASRRAGRRDVGRRARRAAPPRRHVDGPELRPGAEPPLHRDLGDLAGPEVHGGRCGQPAPVPQLDARARRRHRRDRLVLPAPERPLGSRPSRSSGSSSTRQCAPTRPR